VRHSVANGCTCKNNKEKAIKNKICKSHEALSSSEYLWRRLLVMREVGVPGELAAFVPVTGQPDARA